jgi:hypothetical protein
VDEFCRITQSTLLVEFLRKRQDEAEDEGHMEPWQDNARLAAIARAAA